MNRIELVTFLYHAYPVILSELGRSFFLAQRRKAAKGTTIGRAGILPANVGEPLVGSRSEALPAGGYETLPYIFADPMTAFDKRTVKAHNFLCRRELHNFRPRTPPKNVTCQQKDGSR